MKPPDALRADDYTVRLIPHAEGRELVARLHYAGGTSNTGVAVHGLFRRDRPDDCLGVAMWLPPTKGAAIATFPTGDWRRVLSLSRLVIDPVVPTNGASYLLARSRRLVAALHAWDCLVTYADTGEGHTGAIYRADNWEYVGVTRPEYRWVDSAGRMTARLSTHSRTRDEMLALGCHREGPYVKHKFRKIIGPTRRTT